MIKSQPYFLRLYRVYTNPSKSIMLRFNVNDPVDIALELMKKALTETQTLCAGYSKVEPKKFRPP